MMTAINDIFSQPRFRPGVSIIKSNDGIAIEYLDQSCDITFNQLTPQLVDFLSALGSGGKTIQYLKQHYPSISSSVDSLLEEFDRLGLLTETLFSIGDVCLSGHDFYHQVHAFADTCIQATCRSELYDGLKNKTLKREALIGYALEYYYLVRQAPGLIAPSLSHAEPIHVRKTLEQFLASELNHDEMLARSLESVGIHCNSLELMQPLPATISLCASLGVYAKQHPLSFKSLLFLFEMPSTAFNEALRDYCQSFGFPQNFWEPLLRHATVNDDLNHEDITLTLLREIQAISSQEQLITKKHVLIAIETMAMQEKQIIEYYSKPGARIPRLFV